MTSSILENIESAKIDSAAIDRARRSLKEALRDADKVEQSWIAPSDNGWTLEADALRFITSLVRKIKPKQILEFGSGLSTRVLAKACATLDEPCGLLSVDHDPEFGGAAAQEYFADPEQGCYVSMVVAPLVARYRGDKLVPTYLLDEDQLAFRQPFDLVIIDGPPAVLGGREGPLYQVMDFTRSGTLVLLDDADRAEEQTALAHWQENYGDAIEIVRLPHFRRGLAAVIIQEPIKRSELRAHQFRLTRGELQRLLGPEDICIVAGNDWWRDEVAGEYRFLPFLEHEGSYWGAPADDDTAIRELERMRRTGARFVIFGRPFFWWLEHYTELRNRLRARFRCVLENDRLIVFDLLHSAIED